MLKTPKDLSKKNIHANGLIFDDIGIIIRGPSGSGKSLLSLSLLEFGSMKGNRAILVSDDRLDIFVQNNQLIMSVPEQISGKIELAGRGIIECAYKKSTMVHILIDLVEKFERMPEKNSFNTNLLGVELVRCPVANQSIIGLEHQRLLVLHAIREIKNKRSR